MTLLRRVVEEKRAIVLTLAIGLLVNALAYVFVVQPRGARAAGAAARAADAARVRVTAERGRAAAEALVSGKAKADEELSAFYSDVLPAGYDAARRMMDVSLPALADETDVLWSKRSAEVAEPKKGARLGEMATTMVLQGEYSDLRDFIYSLESASDFIVLDDVMLSEGRPDEPLTLVVRMTTYFRMVSGA